MCNASDCNHANPMAALEDDFSGAGPARPETGGVVEKCLACNGTGKFVSWSGRVVGQCFKCKGTGKVTFKAPADVRAKNREQAKARTERKALENVAAFHNAYRAESAWMLAKSTSFDFAAAMLEAVRKYGSLTEKQLAAVRSCMVKDELRAKGREEAKAAAEAREANAKAVEGLEPIETAFAAAQERGVKRPKVRLGSVKLSLAPATGRNAGAIYVVEAASDTYLGKVANGRFVRSRDCTDAQEAEVLEVCADPKAAVIAYGQRTGNCGVCGRELTNHASIDAGIGPICAQKFGW